MSRCTEGHGGVDRYDRNISLERFEVYVNGDSGVISDRFYGGLRDTLGLTKVELGELVALHFKGAINRPPHEA